MVDRKLKFIKVESRKKSKISENFQIFEKFDFFRKLDFSIFKGISIIFEKSCFRKISKFSKFKNFQKIFKNFRDSTLTNYNFRPTQRIFLIFFLWIEVDFDGGSNVFIRNCIRIHWENDFTFANNMTANSRFYIKTRISLSSFMKQH